MKITCIMQARVNSTRLPEKVLKEIEGKTVLYHDVMRVKQSKLIDEIIVATTIKEVDNKIVEECLKIGVKYFRGSEDDVLSRYYNAAKESETDIIVRITSDCPCIDSNIIDEMICEFNNRYDEIDYMSNTIERTFPRGYDVEIFKFNSLKEAFLKATKEFEREHVTPYMYDEKNKMRLIGFKNKENLSRYRVTLDTVEDYNMIKLIYKNLYRNNKYFKLYDVVNFLAKNPNVYKMNNKIHQKQLGE